MRSMDHQVRLNIPKLTGAKLPLYLFVAKTK